MTILEDLARGDGRRYALEVDGDLTGMTVKFCIKVKLEDADSAALALLDAVLAAPGVDGRITRAEVEVVAGPAWPLAQVFWGWRCKSAGGRVQTIDQGMITITRTLPQEM